MNTTQIFRVVWRINALLILAVGVLAFGVLSFAAYEIYKEKARRRTVSEVVNVEPPSQRQAQIVAEWTLGNFESVAETDFLMAPAYSKQDYQIAYYDKSASAVRNYLFVNSADKTSRWLVPGNSALFLSAERLLRPGDNSESNNLSSWTKYEVVKADTNGDGRMTNDDRKTIAVSSHTGEGYAEVIEKVDHVLATKLLNEDALLVIYNSDKESFVAEVNLREKRITATKQLPRVQPQG